MKPKVCFVANIEYSIKVFLLDHFRAMLPKYDITVVTNTGDIGFLRTAGLDINVIRVLLERKICITHDFSALFKLYRIFKSGRFDAVHSITPKSGLLSMIAARLGRVPVRIHTFTGQVWANRRGPMRSILKLTDTITARCATHVLVDSYSQREFLIREKVLSPERSSVIGNGSMCGVDLDRFSSDAVARSEVRHKFQIRDSDTVYLYLGRLAVDKGLLDLADAFSRLCEKYQSAHLFIVGPDEENIKDRILSICGLCSDRVHFEGYTSVPEKFMAASDIFCLPSYREGFGNVIIEAAGMEIPSIGTRIYGLTDAIEDGVTGFFYEPGNTEELYSRMIQLLEDPALRYSLGRRAREKAARDFSKNQIVSGMLEYYHQALMLKAPGTKTIGERVKRLLDIVFSMTFLFIMGIPMLIIACMVKLTSRGPALYWSDRTGIENRIFRMPKFRTMFVDTPEVATHLLKNAGHHVTPFGSVLRKLSLDELPQIVSVLKGDMSLVGPRPALFNQYDLIKLRTEKGVHRILPGVTGWAQINGRDNIPIELKVDFDEYYLRHRSLRLDIKIMFLTFIKAIRAEGVKH